MGHAASRSEGTERTTPLSNARRRLVARAIEMWKRQLTDLGGRNTLLYFRHLRRGTLDLSPGAAGPPGGQHPLLRVRQAERADDAAPAAGPLGGQHPLLPQAPAPEEAHLNRLLSGRSVRLSQLFPDPEARVDAARRARTIRARARENDEERGLETLYLAYGLATWKSERSSATPNAPVLLYKLTLTARGARAEDFTLSIEGEPQVNEALLALLETDFNVRLDPDAVLGDTDPPSAAAREAVLRRLEKACVPVPGFAVAPRVVVGNFSYAKLSLVRDLERAEEAIVAHPLLAAIAGDEGARDELRARHGAIDFEALPPVPQPADEFLVLDADSSQSRVIAAAVAGADLVMVGPPGTGKSQTIANLIATLVARGKSVLFVAEKRAAIEAVSKRLDEQRLGDLLLDLHGGSQSRKKLYENVRDTLWSATNALAPDVDALHGELSEHRTRLEDYAEQLHERAPPWDVSVFEAYFRLLDLADSADTTLRLRGGTLEALTRDAVERAMLQVRQFVELDGPAVRGSSGHPWAPAYAAARVTTERVVIELLETLDELRLDALPSLRDAAWTLRDDSNLREPTSLDDAGDLVDLGEELGALLADCDAGVLQLDLDEVAAALAPATGTLSRAWAVLFNGRYRAARTAVRRHTVHRETDRGLLTLAKWAHKVRSAWRRLSDGDELPGAAPSGVEAARAAHERAASLLERFGEATGLPLDRSQSLENAEATLAALDRERTMLMRFPEFHRLDAELIGAGLGAVLDEACAQALPPEASARRLEYVWLASILDRIVVPQPALAHFSGEAHTHVLERHAAMDRTHIATGKDRVKRAWAERSVRARDESPHNASLVRQQAQRQRAHMPIRALFGRARDVLTAVKPCWVMSPLAVAQVLPPEPCFDVVVFDEASQILPADAISSLLRGRRAIVAGDPKQLPPTTFFLAGDDGGDGADGAPLMLAEGFESVLDVMLALLPPPHGSRTLEWHYRSRDERLIAFSNAHVYDWSLKTFPGALDDEPLRYVLVPFRTGAARVTASVPDEAKRVVELIIEHARTRPGESLGVVALGSEHANAISESLRLVRSDYPDLDEFFTEDQEEAPFVKNLERVQGDERDAIILTTGYGKNVDGTMRYQFGPLNQQGGERRLNVAVTRAKRRMTVVSSFSGQEMDPERLNSEGPKLLRGYLLYAASGGADLGPRAIEKPVLNAFERDVRDQLKARGVPLIPQYGASRYWIDFAAMHPDRPGQPVLAIEADGASYHSLPTARDRDRLRQQHLEDLDWRFHRIWSTEWFRNREQEVERAVAAWRQAVRESDNGARAHGGQEPDDEPPTTEQPAPPRRGPWPKGIRPGLKIGQYSRHELRQIVRWIKSDGRLHTEEELLPEVMAALQFKRRGSKIVDHIQWAIAAERDA